MMAELLAVPLKKPSDVDVIKPLTNLIGTTYSTADKPEDYSEQINEFSKLRNNAIWRVFEKYESSLEVIYGYYDQLQALEAKIPPSDVQIPFKWKDAFNKGSSLFGGKISLTLSSLGYERVCVLFNIASLQSAIAANQSIENDDGLKLAAKLLQMSSGIFGHLKNTVMAAMQVEPTPDLNPETLGAISSLMLAQAQEIFVYKAIHDQMKDGIIAKLASQCEAFYADALKLLQKDSVRNVVDKDWVPTVAGKQAAFHGLAEYYQSLVCKENKDIGEGIARLQKALELLKNAQSRSGKPTFFQDHVAKVERALKDATKDNDFIYHDRVPESKMLSPVPKAQLAKPTPFPNKFSSNFKDLFEGLVPVPVHQALAAYDVRKSDLVNREINELRKATQLLNSVLASLNLPASLEETSGEAIPQSMIEKSDEVRRLGGVRKLDSMINELPELLQRNTDILNECERLLHEEEMSDNQLKDQFKDKWTRLPSGKLTETFKSNISKYRELINTAIHADKTIREKYDTSKHSMALLSEGVEAMRNEVPCGTASFAKTPSANALRLLMSEVETLKAERDTIEIDLKSATVDMKEAFLMALGKDNTINEAVMSTEALGRSYGALQQQVKDSINRQQTLLAKIQERNNEFSQERDGAGGVVAKRESILKDLATAHASFIELQNNLTEGTKFYNDLTMLLVALQNKISDFCFARKTEKEELMKDLTQELSRTNPVSSSDLPTVHAGQDTKRTPPARPPPPVTATAPHMMPGSSATLPYPSQPHMPMPYTAFSNAPYPSHMPPPMPMGYNPYATIAGYPQHTHMNYQYAPPNMQGAHFPQQSYPTQQPPQWQQPQQ